MGLQTTNPMCLVQPTRNHTKQQCAGHRCVCSFFTVFLHSPKPFARCKKQGHYMLIKMSEVLKKKNTDQEMIFLFEKDLAEQK